MKSSFATVEQKFCSSFLESNIYLKVRGTTEGIKGSGEGLVDTKRTILLRIAVQKAANRP